MGIILLILVAYFTDYSIFLLIEGGQLSNTDTYQLMVSENNGELITRLKQVCKTNLAMVDPPPRQMLDIRWDWTKSLVKTVVVNSEMLKK
ncbi:solute carrier family 38 member 11 [Elysia marginata]|uniref:Solute carrier family 38 member 11 n=1 Tax=Elysia marginata TaxID=1093978 RepID=A0AAV4H0Y9_9GAST|nr:solute carrier family 38 member 11 [Elysia marginata]